MIAKTTYGRDGRDGRANLKTKTYSYQKNTMRTILFLENPVRAVRKTNYGRGTPAFLLEEVLRFRRTENKTYNPLRRENGVRTVRAVRTKGASQ